MSKSANPFGYFNSSPEVIRLAVMMYVRFPLSLRNVEDLLFERRNDICRETVRFWWNRFGPMFASEIRSQRVSRMRGCHHWRWHVDEVFVKINGERHYLWRAVDHEGEILEGYVTKKRDKAAALAFLKKALKRHGRAEKVVADGLRSYPAATRELGNLDRREIGRWLNNRAEITPADRYVIDLMLAHVPDGISASEGAYNRAAFMQRRREIACVWARMLFEPFGAPEKLLSYPSR